MGEAARERDLGEGFGRDKAVVCFWNWGSVKYLSGNVK